MHAFRVHAHRRPRPNVEEPSTPSKGAPAPTADWLGHLTRRRCEEAFVPAAPKVEPDAAGRGLIPSSSANSAAVSSLPSHTLLLHCS